MISGADTRKAGANYQDVYMLEVIHRGFTVRVAAMERKRFGFRYWFSLIALLSTA
jgi:hypothetical protein